jgi:hypothetical protein
MLKMGDWLHPPPPSSNTAIVATSLNSQVFFFLRSVWQVELLTRFISWGGRMEPVKTTAVESNAAIQKRGTILARTVILSVCDAGTIAIDLYPFCADLLIYEINHWVFKQF